MLIEIMDYYSRPDLRANREKLFIFGDNFERKGYGGQAQAARDEPNAIGIATKLSPSAYLTDEYFAEVLVREFLPKFTLLKSHLETGGTIVWPKDGIGTGLAELPDRAPRIWAKLEQLREWLFRAAPFVATVEDGECQQCGRDYSDEPELRVCPADDCPSKWELRGIQP